MIIGKISSAERSVLVYLCDALDAAPDKAEKLLKISKPKKDSTAAYVDVIASLEYALREGKITEKSIELREALR
jgi:hypothetical protein